MRHMNRLLGGVSVVVVTTALMVAGAIGASAHVTPDPSSAPKGAGDQAITFRIPNELDNASTVKVTLQLPQDHPIADVSVLAMPGWTDTVQTRKLSTPIKTDDGSFSEVASEITWTGGKIGPGQYGEFKILAMGLPTDTDQLVFKALQSYDNGTTTAWIETQADAEHPAPVIKLTAAVPDGEGAAPVAAKTSANSTAVTPAKSTSSSNGLAIIGIVVGAIGLIVAIVALLLARGRKTATEIP